MKYISISYHMRNGCETAETCITLPVASEEAAADILKNQCDSIYVAPASAAGRILSNLAALQGYDGAEFCHAEEQNMPWHNANREEKE